MPDVFSIPNPVWLHWLPAFAITLAVGIWFFTQNRFFDYHTEKPTKTTYIALLRAARMRSFAVVGLMALGSIAGLLIEASLSASAPALSAPSSTPPAQDSALPTPTKAAPEPASATITQEDRLERLDEIKLRYEDAFVSYLYLAKCKAISQQGYSIIAQALHAETQGLTSDRQFIDSIYQAAKGSYIALYRDTSCSHDVLGPIQQKYQAFIDALRTQAITSP